jgi:hypothetical protein
MTRLIITLAVLFILWRIVRTWANRSAQSKPPVGGAPRREERLDPRRTDIDYTNVRDAEWRESRESREEGGGRREE